jgi:hypothetical protein
MRERRKHARRLSNISVHVAAGKLRGQLLLMSISPAGGFIATARPPRVDSPATVTLIHEGVRVRLQGKVTRAQKPGGAPPGFFVSWERADAPRMPALQMVMRGLGVAEGNLHVDGEGGYFVFGAAELETPPAATVAPAAPSKLRSPAVDVPPRLKGQVAGADDWESRVSDEATDPSSVLPL